MVRKTQYDLDKEAVRELKLYEENKQDLYFKSKVPIYESLDKKVKKGTYDKEKAEKVFKYHADRSAKSYNKEYLGESKGYGIFGVPERKALAKELREEYEEERGLK